MPTDATIDFVVMFLTIGMLALLIGSIVLGWVVRTWDRLVNRSQAAGPLMSPETAQTARTERTDARTDQVSEADRWLGRLEVDRTRSTVLEILLTSGWTITDMRREGIFRGDNATISAEVEATKKKLGIIDEPRQLRVKDEHGERVIPMTP